MIKANELRIGNYVQHEPYPDERWLVDMRLLESIDLELVECVGIPLTTEILVKCGFELFPWGWVSRVANKRSVRITAFHFLFEREGQTSLKIKSLHQLQNLYFALTGEELEVSLK